MSIKRVIVEYDNGDSLAISSETSPISYNNMENSLNLLGGIERQQVRELFIWLLDVDTLNNQGGNDNDLEFQWE